MADNDDTPPIARVGTRRRLQSVTEREHESERARREREQREREQRAQEQEAVSGEITEAIPEDITGRYEGDELEMYRSKRPTDERIAHLEHKHDRLTIAHQKLAESVNKVAQGVSEIRGEMKIIPKLVEVLEKAAERKDEREHVTVTTKLEVEKAQALDPIKAREARRGWITSLIAIVMTIVATGLAILKAKGG